MTDAVFTRNALDPPAMTRDGFDIGKAYENQLARQKWGPDMPWYLPESLVGDWLYRHQGVLAHGAMAAFPYNPPPLRMGNLAYIGYSLGTGRTQRPKIGADGIPLTDNEVPGASGEAYSKKPYESKRTGERAEYEAWKQNHELEKRLGLVTDWSGPKSLFGQHPEPDDAKRAQAVHDYLTSGGVGNAPY